MCLNVNNSNDNNTTTTNNNNNASNDKNGNKIRTKERKFDKNVKIVKIQTFST